MRGLALMSKLRSAEAAMVALEEIGEKDEEREKEEEEESEEEEEEQVRYFFFYVLTHANFKLKEWKG